jgi:hypothetical protein
MVFVLFLGLLVLLALLTAYTRNYQRTVLDLDQALESGGRVVPRLQTARTIAVALGWPLVLGIGLMFVAWWKAVALVVGSFLLMVPVIGSLTPRPSSRHFVERIRADLERRLALGDPDPELRRLSFELEQRISGMRGGDPG